MAWAIRLDPRAERDLARLDKAMQRKVIRYPEMRVVTADEPKSLGKALTGPLAGLCRYRVDDYHIVCRIQSEQISVLVPAIGHRKDIYSRQIRET